MVADDQVQRCQAQLKTVPAGFLCDEESPHAIGGHRNGHCMVAPFQPWPMVRSLAKVEAVRGHDLRHTFASVAVAQGGSLPIIGKVLGHRA